MALKFATLTSQVDLPFWASLASQKVDEQKLDESERPLSAFYEIHRNVPPEASSSLQIHGASTDGEALDLPRMKFG